MPRVRFLQHVAGHAPGDEVDMSADEARAVADNSTAELVREEAVETPERDVTARSEKAAAPRRATKPKAKTATATADSAQESK
jgi:hypothetical protein